MEDRNKTSSGREIKGTCELVPEYQEEMAVLYRRIDELREQFEGMRPLTTEWYEMRQRISWLELECLQMAEAVRDMEVGTSWRKELGASATIPAATH